MKRKSAKRKTRDAVKILDSLMGNDKALRRLVEEAKVNANVAQLIYEARTRAGLTQQQLAEMVGTQQPVIARLEDADYEGRSLTMLQRIATALNQRLEIRFMPLRQKAA